MTATASKSKDGSSSATRIAIIGAGMGGLGAAAQLKREGFTDIQIFDRWPSPGGTWWINKYPGLEVDTNSHVYRHSFHNYSWPQTHPTGEQVLGYVESLIQIYDLEKHLHLSTTVTSVQWNEDAQCHTLETDKGSFEAELVISAVGLLSEPNYPDWARQNVFEGEILHTGEWDNSVSLKGKKVAIVGTGSSAASVIPAISDEVAELFVYQRDPCWVLPKDSHQYTREEREKYSNPQHAQSVREDELKNIYKLIANGKITRLGTEENANAQRVAEDHLESVLGGHPELKAALTPKHPFLGKRTVIHSSYLETFTKPNVHLIPQAVTKLGPNTVVAADGSSQEVDILILATGFTASDFLSSVKIIGRDGVSLAEYWDSEPRAFLGISVPNFPNFFMLYGPNTNGSGSVLLMMELQTEFAVWVAKKIRAGKISSAEVKERYFHLYNNWLDQQCANTVFHTTRNYYKSPSGRIVTNWPLGIPVYKFMTRALRRPALKLLSKQRKPITELQPTIPAQASPVHANEDSASLKGA